MSEWSGRAATRGNTRLAILASEAEAPDIAHILAKSGAECVLAGPEELREGIASADLAAAILTAEALSSIDLAALERSIGRQPPWSDFPFVLIAERTRIGELSSLIDALGHVALVERPIDPLLLLNAAQAALRSRLRQREAEAYLMQRESAEAHLRQLTLLLETRVRERMQELKAANEQLVREVEERQAAEERLRNSEELYRYMVELSRQMVWTADPEGRFLHLSRRFTEVTGEYSERSLQHLIHPEDLHRATVAWREAVATGREHLVEFRMRTLDGSYRMFRSRAAPRRDEEGRITCWYGSTEDIHEQKQADTARRAAEERLRESEELHRYTLELSEQIAWTARPDGTFLSISPRFTELTGYPQGPFRPAVHPDDFSALYASWTEAVTSGEPYVAEFRMRVIDGSYRLFRTRAAPRRDGDGRIIRWYGTTEDIQEQKEAELARAEAEERYRLAARATSDAIWDLDLVSNQIRWNDAEKPLFGYSATIGVTPSRWWEDRIHPEDHEAVLGSFNSALTTGESRWTASYRFRRADGSYADILDRGFIIRDEQGRAARAVGAMMDVTERRRAEAELRRLQAELIHVSRLSAMGTMASTLAHEINQPLTAVTSYLRGCRRILDEVELPAVLQVRGALEAAEAGAIRAGQIVRRLRELVSRGNVTTSPEELPTLIQEACLIAFVDEHLLGVTHRLELDPSAAWVEVDRIQIQQVLINLIRNAVQAMQDQPRREVVISTVTRSEEQVEICVTDTGGGIPSQVREALFSPFQSTKAEGMGIGLSISRTIVEAHGGRIWAEDHEGGGAMFRFTLPRIREPVLRRETADNMPA